MGSGLLGRAEGAEHEHEFEFERALAEGRVADAAELAVLLARRRLRGVGPSLSRIERTLELDGLAPASRIALVRELAMLHARGGCFDHAFQTMTLALTLAQEAGEHAQVCEAELRGAFFAVQVGELASAHDLLDNAEQRAAELGDDLRLGFARVVRGVVMLAEDEADDAVWLIADGVRRITEADRFDRAFVLRQYARALVAAGRGAAALRPLRTALESAREREDHTQLADCLETFAAAEPGREEAACALGAAEAYRSLGESARWADESVEAEATLLAVRAAMGYDRADELGVTGRGDPDAVAAAVLRLLDS